MTMNKYSKSDIAIEIIKKQVETLTEQMKSKLIVIYEPFTCESCLSPEDKESIFEQIAHIAAMERISMQAWLN